QKRTSSLNLPNATQPPRSPLGLAGSWPAIMQAQCSFSQPITSLPTRKLSRKRWLWLPKQLRRQASLSPSGSNQHGPVPATVTLSKANQSFCASTPTMTPSIESCAFARNPTAIWPNHFEKDQQGNAANCAITAIDSSNNIVFEEDGTTIALLGVHDLIVVRTKDALLVCHRHEAEKIKNLIGKLPPELQ